jgi:hypothetical protein
MRRGWIAVCLTTAISLLSSAATAQQVVCDGDRVPLNTSFGGSPLVNMQLGGHEGYFKIDTGATISLIDAETFALAPKAKRRLTGSSLPTIDGGTFLAMDLRGFAAPGGHIAGVIGTDFLSRRIVEFHFDAERPFMILSLRPCSEQSLRDGGFIAIDQKGYFTSDPLRQIRCRSIGAI